MQETGHGLKMHRSDWTDEQFAEALQTLVSDSAMRARLAATREHMQREDGTQKAARLLSEVLNGAQ